MDKVILKQLIMHNWSDGEVQSTYPLGDYKSKFGTVRLDYEVKGQLTLIGDRITTTFTALTFTNNSSSRHSRRPVRVQSAN